MSRCFPFPPPGYEKKPKAEKLDLLTKEKRKEKHHKKEKKEKEKREHKDKKEKDRSKDKRKEKKERKERHKDRKKDRDIIDKGRSSEDRRAEDRNEGTHNPENLQKVEEGKDSKFAEELGRRIRDNGADNRMLGSITSSVHRKIEQVGGVTHPSLDKNSRVTDKRMFPVPIGSSQRNDGSNLPIENTTNSPYRRIGTITTATSMDQDRSKSHERLTVGINTDQNRNHGTSRSIEGIPGFVNRKAEKIPEKNLVPNSIIAPAIDNNKGKLGANVVASNNSASNKRKNDFLGSPAESLSSVCSKPVPTGNSFVQRRMDGMGALPAIDKGRVKGSGMLPHPFSSDQRRNTANVQRLQKDKKQKVDRQDEAAKGLKDSEHEHTAEKNKPKDTYKPTKEEEEKIAEKAAVIENNYIRNFGKKDPIDTLNSKPLAPHKDNTASIRGVDETSNKRKNLKINGFIQENDVRPNKMLRMAAPSSQPLAGSPLKPDRVLDHKEKEIKGSVKPQQLPDGNGELSLKAPHPDSKYLEQIYTVPKMVPLLENDDMDWLFNRCDSSHQKPKRQPASEEGIPQVWAQASWIKSADVLAMPYVVPF